jgi:hypothetical protein
LDWRRKPLTAKIVHEAAAKFKPKKTTKAVKAGIDKPVPVKGINLKPALTLLARAEKAPGKISDKVILKTLASLRKWVGGLDA